MSATNKEKAEAAFAAVLGIAQLAALFGVVSGSALQLLTGNEVIIVSVFSATIGVVQTVVRPVFRKKSE